MFLGLFPLHIHQDLPAPIGEVSFNATKYQIVLPATINGKSLTLIFDTGFGGDVVADTSLDLGKKTGTITLQDFVGTLQAPTYSIKSIQLGTMKLDPEHREIVGQDGASSFGEGQHVDGLMGFSVIKDYVTTISFKDKKFYFYPSSLDISKWKPDGKTTFLLPMLPIGQNAIVLPVMTSKNKQMVLSLDTGNAFYATTHKDVLERVGLWNENQTALFQSESEVASGTVTSWSKNLTNLTIFGVPVPQSDWDIIDRPAASADSDGTVGYQFLKNFDITFDFKRRFVFLKNVTGKVAPDPEGSVGLSAVYSRKNKAAVIYAVSNESPADKAGIKAGDLLYQIGDDDDFTDESPLVLRSELIGPIGTEVNVSVSHEGFLKIYKLKRESLVNP